LPGYIYGVIIYQSAVYQHFAIEINRGKYPRNRHAGTHCSGQYTVVENDLAAIYYVVRYASEWDGESVEGDRVMITHCQFGKQL